MPTITPSFTYVDGASLNSELHNKNVYDNASGRGIMSTANGGLDKANLDSGFRVHSEHIVPQTLLRTSTEFSLRAIDCFEDAFASDTAADDFSFQTAPDRLWVPVPSCGLRFYLPSRAECLLRLSFFCHPFKISYKVDKDGVDTTSFDMAIALRLNGELLPESKRPFPSTARYETAATTLGTGYIQDVPDRLDYSERPTATWYDFHSLKNLTAGVHELELCIYMERVGITREKNLSIPSSLSGAKGHVKLERARYSFSSTDKVPSGSGLTANRASAYGLRAVRRPHILFQRATFGIRQARVLAMKSLSS